MNDPGSPPASGSQTQESAARDKAHEVAGQAQEKAQEAAGKAQDMVREQVDQRSTQAGERVSGAAEDIRSVGEELRKQGKDGPAKIADQAAQRAESVGSYLTESDADKVLSDLEDFGRRKPLAVLAGGLALGVVAARFLKASSRSRYQGRTRSEGARRELGTAGAGLPATEYPPEADGARTARPEPLTAAHPAMQP